MFTAEQMQAAIQAVIVSRDQLTQQVVNQALRIAELEAKVAELTPKDE